MSISNILNELVPPDDKCPYMCTINISLSFSKMLPDGNIMEHNIPTDKLLAEYQISKNALFTIFGFTLDECIQRTKGVINQLDYENNNGK